MKLGIIRCKQTEDFCPGTGDFKAIQGKTGVFAGIDTDIEITGFTNCGGCPGKKAVLRAKELVKRGADTIAFASCIQKGTPIGYPCPFAKKMKSIIENELGDAVKLLDYTGGLQSARFSFLLPGTLSAGQCLAFAERISKTYADKFLELQFGIPTILGS